MRRIDGIIEEKQFIKDHAAVWKELKVQTAKIKRASFKPTKAEVDNFIILYNTVSNHLAYSRTYYGECDTTLYLNKLLGAAHAVIYSEKKTPLHDFFSFFAEGFPKLFRKNIKFFIVATLIFVLSGAFSYIYTAVNVENALAFVPAGTLSSIREEGQYDEPDFNYEFFSNAYIGTNNITVCITAFVLGFTLGIGTVYYLAVNGLLIGVLGGFVLHKHQSLFFWSLIVPHGVPELFAIFLSALPDLLSDMRLSILKSCHGRIRLLWRQRTPGFCFLDVCRY